MTEPYCDKIVNKSTKWFKGALRLSGKPTMGGQSLKPTRIRVGHEFQAQIPELQSHKVPVEGQQMLFYDGVGTGTHVSFRA